MSRTASRGDRPGVRVQRDGRGGGGSLRRIFVPVDTSGRSAPALALAAEVTCLTGGELRVVHFRTFDPPMRGCGRFYHESSADATAVLERAVTAAWAAGCRASGIVVDVDRSLVARAICVTASDWRADLIVLARRPRRAIGILFLGSVAHQVMRQAHCPVLVVRPEQR